MDWIDALLQGYLTIEDTHYDLTHLVSTTFDLALEETSGYPAVTIQIIVEYTSHCVSFGVQPNEPPLDFSVLGFDRLLYDHRRIKRAFCFDRYALSKLLPSLVHQLKDQKCLFTGQSNWVVVNNVNPSGTQPVSYLIFFQLRRTADKKLLRLVIESAYEGNLQQALSTPKKRRSNIRFRVMAAKVLRGEPIRMPNHF